MSHYSTSTKTGRNSGKRLLRKSGGASSVGNSACWSRFTAVSTGQRERASKFRERERRPEPPLIGANVVARPTPPDDTIAQHRCRAQKGPRRIVSLCDYRCHQDRNDEPDTRHRANWAARPEKPLLPGPPTKPPSMRSRYRGTLRSATRPRGRMQRMRRSHVSTKEQGLPAFLSGSVRK